MNTATAETTALGTAVAVLQIVFYLSPLLIALATLFLAWWRFKIFRVREPAITTDLQVSSRRSSPSYNALSAVVVMTNTSRVAVRITGLTWRVQVLAPYSDEDVTSKIDEYTTHMEVDGAPIEFPWNVNYTISQVNTKIALEPGEANTISMSLALPDWIEAVDILIELDSPRSSEGSPLCWAARCQHDLKTEV
ncbi:MAG: hypothetical protein F4X64_06045 [Chloroflexi bacterium]|nr:hypothetical protein [Chloroflexota bacterium]